MSLIGNFNVINCHFSSRRPVAILLPDCKTHTILNAFMHNWLSLHGVPKKLTTDKGSQFLSSEWKDEMTFLGIQHIHTTAGVGNLLNAVCQFMNNFNI